MSKHIIVEYYDELREKGKENHFSEELGGILSKIFSESLNYLDQAAKIDLLSKVDSKKYFAFTDGNEMTRAINSELYYPDFTAWENLKEKMENSSIEELSVDEISKIIYTVAISFCACIDLIKARDNKTPGTFFEYYTAYFFTWRLGVEPVNSIPMLTIDEENAKLPTDYIFNLGEKEAKFHLPVKTSTRERSIMLWAHQKLLDGVYGIERFMGTPIIMNEVKTSKSKKEVVEICVPEQWRLYQLYIAQLKRIYYLDLPASYKDLGKQFPPIKVKPFAEFFFEWDELTTE